MKKEYGLIQQLSMRYYTQKTVDPRKAVGEERCLKAMNRLFEVTSSLNKIGDSLVYTNLNQLSTSRPILNIF